MIIIGIDIIKNGESMMKNKIINFLFSMFLLSGCSDITNPSNESLNVSSESTSTS